MELTANTTLALASLLVWAFSAGSLAQRLKALCDSVKELDATVNNGISTSIRDHTTRLAVLESRVEES